MKRFHTLVFVFVGILFAACDEKPKTLGDKIGDKVNDGLDRQPGEKVRDAGEDLKDAAKDPKDAVKATVRK